MIHLVIKDLKLFFKDWRAISLTFAIPIALISLFAFAFGGIGKSNKAVKIAMQISDLDNTPESREAIQLLDTLKGVRLVLIDLDQAQDNIRKGKSACVLVIYKGFADSLAAGNELPIELQYDEAKETEVGLLQQLLIPTFMSLPFKIGNPKTMMSNRFGKISKNSSPETQTDIQHKSDGLFDAVSLGIIEDMQKSGGNINISPSVFLGGEIKMTKIISSHSFNNLGLVQAVAGTAVMMLLFAVVGIGTSLLDEKQEGTLKRLLYTPLNPLKILFGKMVFANIISILQLIIMFLFANIVFGLDIFSHLSGMIITVIATAFACSAFGVLLASFARSRQQVQGFSTLIILVMSAIGGSMMPLFFMPAFMQKMAVVSVNYWSIQGFFDVFWRNLPITDVTFISRIMVLLLIGFILNAIAVFLFRRNILKLS